MFLVPYSIHPWFAPYALGQAFFCHGAAGSLVCPLAQDAVHNVLCAGMLEQLAAVHGTVGM